MKNPSMYFKPPFRIYNFDGTEHGWYIDDADGVGVTTGCVKNEALQLWYALNKTFTKLPYKMWPQRNLK
jgi:hypothetical protein